MAIRYRVKQPEFDAVQWTGDNATEITDLLGLGSSIARMEDASLAEINSAVLYAIVRVGDWILSDGDSFLSFPAAYFADTYEVK